MVFWPHWLPSLPDMEKVAEVVVLSQEGAGAVS